MYMDTLHVHIHTHIQYTVVHVLLHLISYINIIQHLGMHFWTVLIYTTIRIASTLQVALSSNTTPPGELKNRKKAWRFGLKNMASLGCIKDCMRLDCKAKVQAIRMGSLESNQMVVFPLLMAARRTSQIQFVIEDGVFLILFLNSLSNSNGVGA